MKKNVLKTIDVTELIHDTSYGITKQIRTYQLGDSKFQIVYENSNGSPIGFNDKMCLRQYDKIGGRWNNLEDISVLSMKKTPSYFSSDAKPHMLEFFKKMEERLVKIYS